MMSTNFITNDEVCQKRLNEVFLQAIKDDNLSLASSLIPLIKNTSNVKKILKTKMKEMLTNLFESMDIEEAFDRLSPNYELNYSVARFKILRDINKTI